ncbi:Transmembrane protein like [Thalictrum thalictroides]|uniref:Transmembrane protein like n=1 Tax=Thalictrum thalictroides TaxID=46969 RepID=A0A7J6X1H0_THATH|nr:Transmembrane protein like [Thalictrum thalictroides]
MGTLIGHVAPGFGFFLIGLWHLFNHAKLYALHPNSYRSSSWFKTSFLKYLELYLIIVSSTLSIAMELFIGPDKHQPLDIDGTIPSNHLHNFEHSSISMSFLIYATFAILLDKFKPKAEEGLTQLLAALAFGQQLLLFHLHSADHMGVEGQYHLLLQLIVSVSFITTLLAAAHPRSFLISFVRSISIFLQGVWFMIMGFMLWTPELIPKGCFINLEEGHNVVRCEGDHALHRAKSLVNIQFSWILTLVSIFSILFYLIMIKMHNEKVEYWSIENMKNDEDSDDIESQKKTHDESTSFIHIGKGSQSIEMER